MSYPFRYILTILGLVVLFTTTRGVVLHAQARDDPVVRTAGTVTNLFHTLDPVEPVDGVRLVVPGAWDVEQIHLLRYGTERIPVRMQRTSESDAYLFTTTKPIDGPHELVLRVRIPRMEGTYDWRIHSLVRNSSASDSVGNAPFVERGQVTKEVSVQSRPPVDRTNHALSLDEATSPLTVQPGEESVLGEKTSFTIEFWMLTNGLDEVIMSAWNGNESIAYPAEFVVDQSGRLRFYSGEAGNHRALRSGTPVADGRWHHVAVVYDHRASEVRLTLDGSLTDSASGYSSPARRGPLPLALGGRLNQPPGDAVFSGHLDEVRVWDRARSNGALRRAKSRALSRGATAGGERGLVRLGFETASEPAISAWPEGARREPVALTFRSGLRHFQADTKGRAVTLRWAVEATDVDHFVVEQSGGGTNFSDVAVLQPSEVKQPTASEIPEFAFTDDNVSGSVVYYRVRTERTDGSEHTSRTIKIGLGPESEREAPVELVGNFPNPFTKTTTIAFEVHEAQPVALTVWDLAGHRIATLIDEEKGTGYHEAPFEASNLPSGTYFVRLETPTGTQSHRMVVLK